MYSRLVSSCYHRIIAFTLIKYWFDKKRVILLITVYNQEWLTIDHQEINLPLNIKYSTDNSYTSTSLPVYTFTRTLTLAPHTDTADKEHLYHHRFIQWMYWQQETKYTRNLLALNQIQCVAGTQGTHWQTRDEPLVPVRPNLWCTKKLIYFQPNIWSITDL